MIFGGEGFDTLRGPDVDRQWSITGLDQGQVGLTGFAEIENLLGGSGQDDFIVADKASVRGTVDGGDGFNTLDLSEHEADVVVHLLVAATTVPRSGVRNIRSIRGGRGEDTLIGANPEDIWALRGTGIGSVQGA